MASQKPHLAYASPFLWNQISFRQPLFALSSCFTSIVTSYCAYHHSHYFRFHHLLLLDRLFTPDLKLISYINPSLSSIRTASTDVERTWTCIELSGHSVCFCWVSSFKYFGFCMVTCARLSWPRSSFSVHVKLFYRIYSSDSELNNIVHGSEAVYLFNVNWALMRDEWTAAAAAASQSVLWRLCC